MTKVLFFYDQPQVVALIGERNMICVAIDHERFDYIALVIDEDILHQFQDGEIDLLAVYKAAIEWGFLSTPDGIEEEDSHKFFKDEGNVPDEFLPKEGFVIRQQKREQAICQLCHGTNQVINHDLGKPLEMECPECALHRG
jgi:hypothetical protein